MPQRIQLKTQVPPELVETLRGEHLDKRHYNRVLGGKPVDVYKPDGSLLALLRPGALTVELCEAAYPALYKFGRRASDRSRMRGFKTAIVGYLEDGMTALTRDDVESWAAIQPYISECHRVFRKYDQQLGGRYAIQMRAATTNPKHCIGDTAFSTMAINLWDCKQDGRSTAHKDGRDLPEGFGVISAVSRGSYQGGYLVIPTYRVAFDIRTTDVLLYDPHEMHGNAPIPPESPPNWQRLSTVLFFLKGCKQGE